MTYVLYQTHYHIIIHVIHDPGDGILSSMLLNITYIPIFLLLVKILLSTILIILHG